MNKHWTLFTLSWQKQMEVRSDFFFERIRSISILFSLYFLWSALLSQGQTIFGYEPQKLLTYVLVMTLLRAWVLGCVTDRMPQEIAKGNLSDILLRPISNLSYWATQDMANKGLNLTSAIFEVGLFMLLVGASLYIPQSAITWVYFALSVLGGMVLYFQFSYLLGVMGFWTAQSWGPRFCFEVILEFCAGAYFPIDVLPLVLQKFLAFLPFPYLIFYPISIYLERISQQEIITGFMFQLGWIFILSIVTKIMWAKGLRQYASEGR